MTPGAQSMMNSDESGGRASGRVGPMTSGRRRAPPTDLERIMERGSNRLSVHRDEEMKHELQGLLRSGRSTRTEEWNDPEPTADDDDPVIAGGPVTPRG